MAARTATKQPTLRRKAKNEAVTRLQKALRDAGFDPGPVDGAFGSGTQRAVKAFQASCGLEADGIVGKKTWAALAAKPVASALTHAAQAGEATSSGAASKPPGKLAVSKKGLEHIAEFEGFRPKLYNDPAGHATIGFGHLVHKGKIDGSEPAEFRKGISRERALELLRADAASAEAAVRSAVTVPLVPNQFDALVSFVFNVGAGAFRKSTLLKRINAGDHAAVRSELARWNKGGGKVLPGLVRRRESEADLYERGGTGAAAGTSATGKAKPSKKAPASATADAVRATQKAFNTCGFPCGKVDGEVGEATIAAVRRFQTAYAGGREAGALLKQDGVLGSKTVAAAKQLPLLSPHFKAAEFRSKGDGSVAIRRELVLALEQLRVALGGRPLKIVSGYRDPAHNKKVGGATNSMHMHGLAADLEYPCTVAEVRKLKLFSGIGHKNDRVRHVDLRHLSEHNKTPAASLSNPTMWKY